jgi:predicted RNA-binding Zn-ribbon protein involved in translation (DUF1610 family)
MFPNSLGIIQSGRGGTVMDDLGGSFPRNFGVDDKPRCPNCGELAFLSRRSPAGEHALEYERQRFTCPGCGQEHERIVDADGFAVELEDIRSRHVADLQ